VLAVLQERAGGIDQQARFAFGESDLGQVDAAGGVDGRPGITEGYGDVDVVQPDVHRPERGPPQVRVAAQPAAGIGGLGQQAVCNSTVAALGRGHGPAQQQ
jgi:hypothetical protein